MNYLYSALVSAIVAVAMCVLFITGIHSSANSESIFFGGTPSDLSTLSNPYAFTNTTVGTTMASTTFTGFKAGQSGTRLTLLKQGTCSLIGYGASAFTVAATTTATFDCAVTGVVYGDNVFAQLGTSTASTAAGLGWFVSGAMASTTSGYITLNVTNGLGASTVIPASIASSTKYFILR